MKGKPVKHKTTNTFRFVPFAERINSIDIRHAALYHIEHANTERLEENESYFHYTLNKWYALNLTENFKKFRKEVFGIKNVAQLLHNKDKVIETLEKYLNLDDQLCLQPLLEVLVALAKDLRDDFYQHFPKFLDILIKFLSTKDAEKLEWTLICLAFLFKILKQNMKKDIASVLKRIIPLLSESQPQYINNFAAESFAFVTRDIRDKKSFIQLLLNYLQKNENAVCGCGHLIFEMMKGISRRFHSCVEEFLPLLLQHLKENKNHQEILFRVLTQTIEDCLEEISSKQFEVFWSGILKYLEEILNDDDENKGLEYILRLAGQVIQYQEGKYLTNPPEFLLMLVRVIGAQTSESVLDICSKIAALLLLSNIIHLSQQHAGVLVRVILPLPYPDILVNFVSSIIDYSQFNMQILQPYLNYVVLSNFDNEAMSTLAKICLKKSPLSKNGIELFKWTKYPLDFKTNLTSFMEYLYRVLGENIDDALESPLKLMNLLFCLPHVVNIDVECCITSLSELISKLLKILSLYNIEHKSNGSKFNCDKTIISTCARKVLFILANAVECTIHISCFKRLNQICDIDELLSVVLPCALDPNYLVSLHLLDLYLTAYEQENGLKYSHLLLIDSYLRSNVGSPFHIVRLLTTHIYQLFENIKEFEKSVVVGGVEEKLSIFIICYEVESTSPSIQDYRQQLNLLRKMAVNTIQYTLVKETDFHLYPLNYMLGVLYMNFKLLWEPVSEFIVGYANSMPAENFWPLFYNVLETSFANAKRNIKLFQFNEEINIDNGSIDSLYLEYCNITERIDFYNYRILLLKIMTNSVTVCEAKNRDVVVLFLNFIDEEYRRNDSTNALKIDVETHDKTTEMVVEEVNPEENIENEEDNIVELSEMPNETANGKIIFKTLIHVMQVLSQFKNPRALHKEPIFWELYMEFLKHKNCGLQKYALDCVLNYKNKSVVPYKSNLCNLVDDNKFKDELTLFKISEDSQSIRSEDREHVVPLILRILYGKMTSKLGADKKGGGQTQRSLIMRNLAGCSEDELKIFIEMAFSHFKQYFSMEPKEIYDNILSNLDLKSVISPGKLHSMINLFNVVHQYFGGYMKDRLLQTLFKVFYAVSSTIGGVLAQGEKVHVGYVKVMKNLRTLALVTLRKLFEQFEKYPWSKEELFVIFETLVWPLIPRLQIEGIHSPTALLKLINTWCQNPRYYILLVTCSEKDASISPIPAIFELLSAPRCHNAVVNMILDMIEKLLTLTEGEDSTEVPDIESFNTIAVDDKQQFQNINFGSKILIPHLSSILKVMKTRIANSAKSNTVNKRDLLILSRVTELVTTPEICDELLNLLLPILVRKVGLNMTEENMEHAVVTIINLLGHSTNPQIYIKKIAVLFNKVSPIQIRKILLKLLNSIAENSSENKEVLTRNAHIITEMNAFNQRWIEQPDFDKRLDAYKKIYELSESNQIDVDLAVLIVHNCFYFIRTEKDIALRDAAGLCLKKILPRLFTKYWSTTDGQFLVRDTVLSLISTGIRDANNEYFQRECITLLGELARECPDTDVVLSDLSHLSNKEDREVDFFDNMAHYQLHRCMRALLKFSKVANKMTKCPSPRTLTNFILPFASLYICNEKYTDKNSLIDACIEVISTCCRLLPWYHYEVILKHYLSKLRHSSDYQKQITRILIGILDAFHYDFSKVKDMELPKQLFSNIADYKAFAVKENEGVVENDDEQEINDVATSDLNEDGNQDLAMELEVEDKVANEEVANEPTNTPAFEKTTVVSPSVAKRIIKSLSAGLLPQLNRAISKLTEHDRSHKLNRRGAGAGLERQQEDMLRVPVALALVQLLQRLPGDLLRHQLPGIITKLCSFLKSPLKQVRIVARDIVKKIMVTVGPAYLRVLLEHLTLLLTRGFQVHVLVATVHTVLDALKDNLRPDNLNDNLPYILDVCTNDLFGALSEEKEIEKLHHNTPEAKPSKKTYVTLTIVSQNISENCLINLLLPFKEVLQEHQSKKIVLKVEEALKHITVGLVANKFIEIESLLYFLHGVASESISEFGFGAPKREITEAQKSKMLTERPDIFLVPQEPKRNRTMQSMQVKTSAKANAHYMIDFSLNILYVVLKREKISRGDCKAFLDPLIPLVVDAFESDNIKIRTVALKCIASLWTVRMSTPTLEENIERIVRTIFEVLRKYATCLTNVRQESYHLVQTAFKAVTMLIRNVKYCKLDATQLDILLLFVKEDCENDVKQASSFTLLKAIVEARLVSPELHAIMDKMSTIVVLGDSDRIREEARNIMVNYLVGYPLGKKLEKFLTFFVAQMKYELQHGRESAIKCLEMIISKLPASQVYKHSEYLLLSVGERMMRDAAGACREAAGAVLDGLLARLKRLQRNALFDLVMALYKNCTTLSQAQFAAMLCIRFVCVEKSEFEARLERVLPIIDKKLMQFCDENTTGYFLTVPLKPISNNVDIIIDEKYNCLSQYLFLFDYILVHCPSCLKSKNYEYEMDSIAQQCKAFLKHTHESIRALAARILGRGVAAVDAQLLERAVRGEGDTARGFLYCDTEESLRDLVLVLCTLYMPCMARETVDQATEVIFQILRLANSMPSFKLRCKQEPAAPADNEQLVRFILYRLRSEINEEVVKAPNNTTVRTSIFTMWMHLIGLLEDEEVGAVVDVMLPAIVREQAGGAGGAGGGGGGVRQLAGRLCKKLRRRLGEVQFGRMFADAHRRLEVKRAERKKFLLQEKINQPLQAAKRKLQIKEKKKRSKKIKLEMAHGKRARPRKRKAEDNDYEDVFLQDD